MKRNKLLWIFCLALALIMVFSIAGCRRSVDTDPLPDDSDDINGDPIADDPGDDDDDDADDPGDDDGDDADDPGDDDGDDADDPGDDDGDTGEEDKDTGSDLEYGVEPFVSAPLAITAAGRSADAMVVTNLSIREGISIVEEDYYEPMEPGDLGNSKTLILVVGGSNKGLGEAGISVEDELARIQSLIDAAKSKNMHIITMHIGGFNERRGSLSDPFCELAAENSHMIIVAQDGNKDGFFTAIADSKGIPLVQVDRMQDCIWPLIEVIK